MYKAVERLTFLAFIWMQDERDQSPFFAHIGQLAGFNQILMFQVCKTTSP